MGVKIPLVLVDSGGSARRTAALELQVLCTAPALATLTNDYGGSLRARHDTLSSRSRFETHSLRAKKTNGPRSRFENSKQKWWCWLLWFQESELETVRFREIRFRISRLTGVGLSSIVIKLGETLTRSSTSQQIP
jgi:hypothetical protein